jgi:hypothetical protein
MPQKRCRSQELIAAKHYYIAIYLYPCYSRAVQYNGWAREDDCVASRLSLSLLAVTPAI